MSGAGYLPQMLLYLLGVLLSSFAQVLLGKEAARPHDSLLKEYVNPRVITGYAIIFGCTILTILAYRGGLPVSWGNVLESAGYVFVTIFGVTILGEKVGPDKCAALAVILAGILLFTL